MAPQEINIEIAKVCGWKRQPIWDDTPNEHYAWEHEGRIVYTYALPNYHGDLNALHEAEKVLTDEQRRVFHVKLELICGRDGNHPYSPPPPNARKPSCEPLTFGDK